MTPHGTSPNAGLVLASPEGGIARQSTRILGVALVVLALTTSMTLPSASAARRGRSGAASGANGRSPGAVASQPTGCAWGVRTTPYTKNVAFPDTNAVYWTTSFRYEPGLIITIEGDFPSARYMSFNVYNTAGASVSTRDPADPSTIIKSSLADFKIEPVTPGTNPFRLGFNGGVGRYAVTVIEHPSVAIANSLPLTDQPPPPVGTTGTVILRAYLPSRAVPLPTFSTRVGSGPVTIRRPCTSFSTDPAPAIVDATSCTGVGCTDELRFRLASSDSSFYPNADSAYVLARVAVPARGFVVVVRGKAPTSPDGTLPTVWPTPQYNVRYWSMCNNVQTDPYPVVINIVGTTPDPGCRTNVDSKLLDGQYTYVVGREDQRAAIEALPWPGITFIPFSTRYAKNTHTLILRNMVPADSFSESITKLSTGVLPEQVGIAMGAYYPRGAVCAITTLQQSGPNGCLP
jgi:hypothetical protein